MVCLVSGASLSDEPRSGPGGGRGWAGPAACTRREVAASVSESELALAELPTDSSARPPHMLI